MNGVSDVTQSLIDQLRERDARGLAKYGVTLDRTDLTASEWLQHMIEELLDAAGYAAAIKRELDEPILYRITDAGRAHLEGK